MIIKTFIAFILILSIAEVGGQHDVSSTAALGAGSSKIANQPDLIPFIIMLFAATMLLLCQKYLAIHLAKVKLPAIKPRRTLEQQRFAENVLIN